MGSRQFVSYTHLGTIEIFEYDAKNPYSISSNFVRACCEDNLGNIWIGTFNGLNRYDKSTGLFQNHTASDAQSDGLTHSSIWCIVKDNQGTLWLGTYFGGVNYFNPEYEIYSRYMYSPIEKKGLSNPVDVYKRQSMMKKTSTTSSSWKTTPTSTLSLR